MIKILYKYKNYKLWNRLVNDGDLIGLIRDYPENRSAGPVHFFMPLTQLNPTAPIDLASRYRPLLTLVSLAIACLLGLGFVSPL